MAANLDVMWCFRFRMAWLFEDIVMSEQEQAPEHEQEPEDEQEDEQGHDDPQHGQEQEHEEVPLGYWIKLLLR